MEKEKDRNGRKNPLHESFGYAFEGIWTGIRKERNMKIHCLAVIAVTAGWDVPSYKTGRVVYLSVAVWIDPVAGTCEYGGRSGCGSCDGGKEAIGKDRKRYSGRGGACVGDCSRDYRLYYFYTIFAGIDGVVTGHVVK